MQSRQSRKPALPHLHRRSCIHPLLWSNSIIACVCTQAHNLWQQMSSMHFCLQHWWGWRLLSLRVVSSHSDKQNANLARGPLTAPFVFVLIVTGADIYPFFLSTVSCLYIRQRKKIYFPAVNCRGETITAWKIQTWRMRGLITDSQRSWRGMTHLACPCQTLTTAPHVTNGKNVRPKDTHTHKLKN